MMNPYPFVALNHFTVPCAMVVLPFVLSLCEFEIGGRGLATLHCDLERKGLTLVQPSQSRGLNRGDVDEHVPPSVGRQDESVSFRGVEPLDGASGHAGVALRCSAAAIRVRETTG